MNTILTASDSISVALPCRGILTDKAARKRFHIAWNAYAHAYPTGLTAIDFLAYSLLLGKPLSAAFTPVTRPSKLSGGRRPYDTLKIAATYLASFCRSGSSGWLEKLGITDDEALALREAALAVNENEVLAEFKQRRAP